MSEVVELPTAPPGWVRVVSKVDDTEYIHFLPVSSIRAIYTAVNGENRWSIWLGPYAPWIEFPDAALPSVMADIHKAQKELLQKGVVSG